MPCRLRVVALSRAACVDMWEPFTRSLQTPLPSAQIVYRSSLLHERAAYWTGVAPSTTCQSFPTGP